MSQEIRCRIDEPQINFKLIDDLTIQYLDQPPIFDDINVLKDTAEILEFEIDKAEKKIKKYKWMNGKRRK